VTPADTLEPLIGVFRSDTDAGETQAHRREHGSWLLPGSMPADKMADQLGIGLPENRDYQTVAEFVIAHMEHLPTTGECVQTDGWRFEVINLDGRWIDEVLATKLATYAPFSEHRNRSVVARTVTRRLRQGCWTTLAERMMPPSHASLH
jgi:putative hemolysin